MYHNYCYSGIIPVSESRDGRFRFILKPFGLETVRRSSRRKGDCALIGIADSLRKSKNVAFAVDGPSGPIYALKQSITYLAGKLNKPIVPVLYR